jgi:hypothetical protein
LQIKWYFLVICGIIDTANNKKIPFCFSRERNVETDLTVSLILVHLGISLVPWIIVMLAGGGLAYLLATLLRRWFQGHPRALELMVLLPWRSIASLIALVMINTSLMMWYFGFGTLSASVSTGVALSVLFVPWITSAFLHSWYPTSLFRKIGSIVRTFAILAIVLPVFLQMGMGHFIYQASYDPDMDSKIILGYEVVGALMVGVDLIGGILLLFIKKGKN